MARIDADQEVSRYLGPGTHVVLIAGARWWADKHGRKLQVVLAGSTKPLRGQVAEFRLRDFGNDFTVRKQLLAIGCPGHGGPWALDDEIDATLVASLFGRVCIATIAEREYDKKDASGTPTGEKGKAKDLLSIEPLPDDKTALAYGETSTWALWWCAPYTDPKTERTVFPADMLTEAVDELRRVWPDFRPRSAWANLPPQLRVILDKLDGAPVATGAVADAAETPF
jgi:hypothetical protein